MELSDNQITLLEITAKHLISEIKVQEDLAHVRQMAFDHCIPGTNEIVQVQITVTRDNGDFLNFLETEEMTLN